MKKLLMVVAAFIILTASSAFGWFDSTPGYFNEFGPSYYMDYEDDPEIYVQRYVNLSGSVTRIHAFGFAEGLLGDYDKDGKLITRRLSGYFAQEGSGFYIGNGYWVTNAHVVKPEGVKIRTGQYSYTNTRVVKILSRTISIGPSGLGDITAEIVYLDVATDIAVIKMNGDYLALEDNGYRPIATYYPTGDMLYKGMPVAVLVEKRDKRDITKPLHPMEGVPEKTGFFEVRYGKIIDTKPALPKGISTDALPWFLMNDVTMDTIIYLGDSGSPVFGFVDGKPVIIGVARAVIRNFDEEAGCWVAMSYFTRIDFIQRFALESN